MLRFICSTFSLTILLCLLGAAQDVDATAKKLEDAKKVFKRGLDKIQDLALKKFDEAEARARANSDVRRVNELKSQRSDFLNTGIPPEPLTTPKYRTAYNRLYKELLQAHREALARYLDLKEDDRATKVDLEIAKLTKSGALPGPPEAIEPVQPAEAVRGTWAVVDGHLQQTGAEVDTLFLFGDADWSEYDFAFDAKIIGVRAHSPPCFTTRMIEIGFYTACFLIKTQLIFLRIYMKIRKSLPKLNATKANKGVGMQSRRWFEKEVLNAFWTARKYSLASTKTWKVDGLASKLGRRLWNSRIYASLSQIIAGLLKRTRTLNDLRPNGGDQTGNIPKSGGRLR